jgi:hypothetical protein
MKIREPQATAGAAVTVSIVTVADARARVQHHWGELRKAMRDLYPESAAVFAVEKETRNGTNPRHYPRVRSTT